VIEKKEGKKRTELEETVPERKVVGGSRDQGEEKL